MEGGGWSWFIQGTGKGVADIYNKMRSAGNVKDSPLICLQLKLYGHGFNSPLFKEEAISCLNHDAIPYFQRLLIDLT